MTNKTKEISFFQEHSINAIIDLFRSKKIKPSDVAKFSIDQILKYQNKYKPFVCFDENHLIENSYESDQKIKNNTIRNLESIPFGVKDIFNTKDFPTQMGSEIWKNFNPGNDARVVYNLKNHGSLVVGKTVTAEFAVHKLNETLNPHDIMRTPGTSSSGSAVAVSLGMVPYAIGSQTAGSIIRPASFCGVFGYKPSYGLIPRTGILKTTDTLDHVGFFSFFLEDLRRILDCCRVVGSNYPFSNSALSDSNRQNKPLNSWKVGFVKTHTWENSRDYVKESVTKFVNKLSNIKGIDVKEVFLPSILEKSHLIHEKIYNKSLSYYFKEEFKNKTLVSNEMKELIAAGINIENDDFNNSLKEQVKMIKEMDNFFYDCDIIISTSTASEAPLRDVSELPDPSLMWSLTHLPAINVPIFISHNNLPFGLQIISRKYNDYLLLNFLKYLNEINLIPSHGVIPKIFNNLK